jgi:hypothetical protein
MQILNQKNSANVFFHPGPAYSCPQNLDLFGASVLEAVSKVSRIIIPKWM